MRRFTPFIALASISFISLGHAQGPTKTPPTTQTAPTKKPESFKPFTGKVLANKVRLRSKADLDGHIVRQMNKDDLLLIVGEQGEFWSVKPPKETKAYVFRSYILDQIVEANRVNVRLEPHVDAPIIGQLQAGDKIQGEVCSMNHKWLEIAPPTNAQFYVSKEFIAQAGGPEYLAVMEKRKSQADQLLTSACLLADSECKKPYEEMAPQEAIDKFQTVLLSYADFPATVERAKEGLALLKDTYLQKKIAYLEARAELPSSAKEEMLAKHKLESQELLRADAKNTPDAWNRKKEQKSDFTDRMRFWDTIEESLYLSWNAFHTGKKIEDFYQEQTANAVTLTGRLESYDFSVKNKPGDYILRQDDTPIAYLYSTQVKLDQYEGKTVTLVASPRPNNHFAFPAYFVISVE